jgi:alpha-tubulin suppressor-like RCC1 family protein
MPRSIFVAIVAAAALLLLRHGADAAGPLTDSVATAAAPYAVVAAGRDFTCVVLMDGRVQCFGLGASGQLGRMDNSNVGYAQSATVVAGGTVPGIPSGVRADAVIAGGCFAGAILKNASQPIGASEPGDLLIWGCCNSGQCGSGSTTSIGDGPSSPVYPAGLVLGLPGGRKVLTAVAGDRHVCVLLAAEVAANGQLRQDVTCFGANENGQLGRGDTNTIGHNASLSGLVALVDLGQGGTRNAVGLCAGRAHTCALDDAGGVTCWGLNSAGQLGLGHTVTVGAGSGTPLPADVGTIDFGDNLVATQVACGSTHTCALLSDSSVRCFGNSTLGQTGLGRTDFVASVPASLPSLTGPVYLFPGTKALAVFAGGDSTAVLVNLTSNARLMTFGANSRGQLGLGNTNNIGDDEVPGNGGGSFPNFGNVDGRAPYHAAIGARHMCVATVWDHVVCVGAGDVGQLGYNAIDDIGDNERASGAGLVALSTWGVLNYSAVGPYPDQIVIGEVMACAILDDRIRVACWGVNNEGWLGLGFTNASGTWITPPGAYTGTAAPAYVNVGEGLRVMRLSMGSSMACAIREDNAVVCWGRNYRGSLGCNRNNEDIVGDNEPASACIVPNLGSHRMPVQVACGWFDCAAVMNDMTTFVWGPNDRRALGMINDVGDAYSPLLYNNPNAGSGQIIAASVGDRHVLFMLENGAVTMGTGQNDNNWLGVCNGCGDNECCSRAWSLNAGLFPRFIAVGYQQLFIIRADNQLIAGGNGGNPTAGVCGFGDNAMRHANSMQNFDNFIISVGGSGQVAAVARSIHGSCYITTDLATRCFGHPYIAAYGAGQHIGDNEHPRDAGPIAFPPAFGTVVPMASMTYSSLPNIQLCMIGSSGQPSCWGESGRYQLGLSRGTTDPCGDNEPASACGVVPMGSGVSVGVYPPTVVAARALPYPAKSGGDALGTVLELSVKYVGMSRNEPRQLIAFLGTTSVGCDKLKRLSPARMLCTLSAPTLLQLRQAIQTTSKTFTLTLQWYSPSIAAQAALNLGRSLVWDLPVVGAVTPSVVDTSTQQRITLTGSGFGASAASSPRIFIGKSECSAIIWQDSSTLSCLTPFFAGSYEVVVTLDGFLYPSRGGAFLSTLAPTVSAISPVLLVQGSVLTISGRGFGNSKEVAAAAGINVTVGGLACFPVIFVSDAQIRCGPAPVITSRNVPVIVNLGGLSSAPSVTISAAYPVITALSPAVVWTGDVGSTHDFNVSGFNLDASASIMIGGVACPLPLEVLSPTTVRCRSLPVNALNAALGVAAVSSSGTPSDVAPLLTVMPRANVTAITPASARPGTSVLIEGLWLGRTAADILNVSLGSTTCDSWRYAFGASTNSIVCVVGPGRGVSAGINVVFVDGPPAFVSFGLTFSYIRDVSLTLAWSAASSSSIALPSSPGSYAIPVTPPLQLSVLDDAGGLLTSSVAASLVCSLAVAGSSGATALGLSTTRLFQGAQATVNNLTGAMFDNLAVEGAMGASLQLRASCGAPPNGPFFSSPLLNLTVARVSATFSTLPVNGSMPTTLGAVAGSISALAPVPVVSFAVAGAPLIVAAAAAALVPCQMEAWPAGAGAASAFVRAIGPTSIALDSSSSIAFPGVGVAAALGASFQLFVRCSWLQNEQVVVLSPPMSLSAVVPTWAAAPLALPSLVQFNSPFSLPTLYLLGASGTPLTGLAQAQDVACSLSVTNSAGAGSPTGVAFVGGIPSPYISATGAISFSSLAVQPQLPDSEATPVPLTLSVQCTVRGQSVPSSVMATVSLSLSIQRLRISWTSAPPATAMPSSCGRSWNSTSLGGMLDAASGLLTGGGQGALASAATLLPPISVALLDFVTGQPAAAETGGLCTIAAVNATFSISTPLGQQHAALGGPTTAYSAKGIALFDSVSLSAPLGSTVVIVVTCARATGGRVFSLSSTLALNDAEVGWNAAATATAVVLTGGNSVTVPALAVVYNATTLQQVTLRVREPYFAMWGPSAPYKVRSYNVGTDPPASCTLVMVRNAVVTSVAGGSVTVPLDLSMSALYLVPGTLPASATLDIAAQPGAAWTVGPGGAVSISFRLAAPLDVPVAVQAYCTMGASTLLSPPLVLVASAAKLAFAIGGVPPYGMLPTFDDDPFLNFLRAPISFGLLGIGANAGFLTESGTGPSTMCTLQVLSGSASASIASAPQLLTCTSDVAMFSSDDAGNVVSGVLLAQADASTGIASFPTAFVRGPLGSAFTLRASCARPALGGPVSILDTSILLADVDVRWATVYGSGLAPTALTSGTTMLQAGVPISLTITLSWLIPVKRTSTFGAAPAPLRLALNASSATPSLVASCSLRVPDSDSFQVQTASMRSRVTDVSPDSSGTVTFQVTFIEPLGVTIFVYADCEFPRGLSRSTQPLLVDLSQQPPPAARRVAVSPGASPSTWVKPTSTATPSFWRIGSLKASSSSTPSNTRTASPTPSSTLSTTPTPSNTPSALPTPSNSPSSTLTPSGTLSLRVSPTAHEPPAESPPASPLTSSIPRASLSLGAPSLASSASMSPASFVSSSPGVISPSVFRSSLPSASSSTSQIPSSTSTVRFDVGIAVPDASVDALFSGLNDAGVLLALASDILGLIERAEAASALSSTMEAPLSVQVAALTNVATGQRIVLTDAPAAQPARRLGGTSPAANIKVTFAASFPSASGAAAASALLPGLSLGGPGAAQSLALLAATSGVPAVSVSFLSVDPASIAVASPAPSRGSGGSLAQPAGATAADSSAAAGSAIGAAVGVAVLAALTAITGFAVFRTLNNRAATAAYRNLRERRLLEKLSDNARDRGVGIGVDGGGDGGSDSGGNGGDSGGSNRGGEGDNKGHRIDLAGAAARTPQRALARTALDFNARVAPHAGAADSATLPAAAAAAKTEDRAAEAIERARASTEALERAARLLSDVEASMVRQQQSMAQQQAAFAAHLHNTLASLTVTATSTASATATAATSVRAGWSSPPQDMEPLQVQQQQQHQHQQHLEGIATAAAAAAAVSAHPLPRSDATTAALAWLVKQDAVYAWLRKSGAVSLAGEKTGRCPLVLEDEEIPFRDAEILVGLAEHGFVLEKSRVPLRQHALAITQRGEELPQELPPAASGWD